MAAYKTQSLTSRSSSDSASVSSLSVAEKLEVKSFTRDYVRLHLIDDRRSLATIDKLHSYSQMMLAIYKKCICGVDQEFADMQTNPQIYYQQQKRLKYFNIVKTDIMREYSEDFKKDRISCMPQLVRSSEQQFSIVCEYYRKLKYQTHSEDEYWVLESATDPMEPTQMVLYRKSVITGEPFNHQHHIISRWLLNQFFDIFEQMETQKAKDSQIHSHLRDIVEHSMQKIHTIRMWGMNDGDIYRRSPQDNQVQVVTTNLQNRSNRLSGSNIFYGPSPKERGPFEPNVRIQDFQLFEFDCEIILGRNRYQDYLQLYKRIKEFVDLPSEQRTNFEADQINDSIYRIEEKYKIVDFNEEHWEKRIATQQELDLVKGSTSRMKYMDTKHWAIKKIQKAHA